MATTGVDFVLQNKATTTLSGAAVLTAPFVEALDPQSARVLTGRVPGGAATAALGSNNSNYLLTLADQGFAKNGSFHVTTSGTTPVTLDLTNLATNATTHAGDTVFATVNMIKWMNVGAADMTIAPGASNPSNAPKFTGTTPTLAVPAGSFGTWSSVAGVTIDSTHKNITITPTAGGDIFFAVGGA
jgi:hypothetical protein